ncbi:MAG: ABC transporter ATP-binding protein [Opitutales bacterium]|nr:ABC transporter ATP-binding protein [Opitutales bacterium]
MCSLKIEDLTFYVNGDAILKNIHLEVPEACVLAILGPGGCGKSTLLKIIAGEEKVRRGKLYFGNKDVTGQSPQRRRAFLADEWDIPTGWRVYKAVEVVARQWGVPRKDRHERVLRALKAVGLEAFAEHPVGRLSTSERNRLYLASGVAVHPHCLLVDDQLASLEPRLRLKIGRDIAEYCRTERICLVWATTQVAEAFALATDLVLMKEGRIEAHDTPRRLWQYPTSTFVAQFLSDANILRGTLRQSAAGMALVDTDLGEISGTLTAESDAYVEGTEVEVAIRPESLHIEQMPADENCFHGTIVNATDEGLIGRYRVATGEHLLLVYEQNPRFLQSGEEDLYFWAAPDDVAILPVKVD